MTFTARFDDLRPNQHRTAGFTDQVGEVVAFTLDEVEGALVAVEQASKDGLWACGFVAYEAASAFDPGLTTHEPVSGLPLVWFGLYETRVVNPTNTEPSPYSLSPWQYDTTEDAFNRSVEEIRNEIYAGNTYQTNFTIRLNSELSGDADALYRELISAQSGGYGTYLDTGRFKILSASPELFFHRTANGPTDRIVTRPMKGTAPRGRWESEDTERLAELMASEKDAAENVMIVDLLRNDLGHIAEFGSVEVEELLTAEKYDTVWQLTSTIGAALRPELSLFEVFSGLFPCGSITGAPKQRTMQIINDLESTPRGVYCGAVGFVAPVGDPGPKASFGVAIRTVVIDSETGSAQYGVGGGITWDSTPEGEYAELGIKAAVLRHGSAEFSLLETILWQPDEGWKFLEEHLNRAQESARFFDIPWLDDDIRTSLQEVSGDGAMRVRLMVSRQGVPTVEAVPFELRSNPVTVVVGREPVDTRSPFLFHKTTRREIYETARAAHPLADDVILTNAQAMITESTIANIAVKLGGKWFTPPVTDGCLPGIYRAELLKEGAIYERSISVSELTGAQGIALINSVRGWRTARLVLPE